MSEPMTEHPLVPFFRDAQGMTSETDPVQGSVEVHLVSGQVVTGTVDAVEADGRLVVLTRIYKGRGSIGEPGERWKWADTFQYIVLDHVVRAFYYQAGA